MLITKLTCQGYSVKQAHEDADTLIGNTTIEEASKTNSVTIVGEDVDLLVILTAALAESKHNLYLLKQGKGRAENKVYSQASLKCESEIKDNILFLHAFSGADTTSAFFRQGKLKFVSLLKKHVELQDLVAVFQNPHADPEKMVEAGKCFILKLYGSKECD